MSAEAAFAHMTRARLAFPLSWEGCCYSYSHSGWPPRTYGWTSWSPSSCWEPPRSSAAYRISPCSGPWSSFFSSAAANPAWPRGSCSQSCCPPQRTTSWLLGAWEGCSCPSRFSCPKQACYSWCDQGFKLAAAGLLFSLICSAARAFGFGFLHFCLCQCQILPRLFEFFIFCQFLIIQEIYLLRYRPNQPSISPLFSENIFSFEQLFSLLNLQEAKLIDYHYSQKLEPMYKVEKVIAKRQCPKKKGKFQYLVKWDGWDSKFNTWEPLKHLEYVKDLVDEFQNSQRQVEQALNIEQSISSGFLQEDHSAFLGGGRSQVENRKTQQGRGRPKKTTSNNSNQKRSKYLLGTKGSELTSLENAHTMDSESLPKRPDRGNRQKSKENKQSKLQPSQVTEPDLTHSKETLKAQPGRNQPNFGGNIKILGMKKVGTQFLFYVVEPNGSESWVCRETVIKANPVGLCQFYEQRIVFNGH